MSATFKDHTRVVELRLEITPRGHSACSRVKRKAETSRVPSNDFGIHTSRKRIHFTFGGFQCVSETDKRGQDRKPPIDPKLQ